MKTVAVDTGGTFTDMVVLEHESGEVDVLKVPSTPQDPGRAIIDGLRELLDANLQAGEVASFTHGTTVGTNILVQDKGARVGLLITDGFSGVNDVWHIPRFGSDLSDIYVEKNPPVEPWLREEIVERVDYQGNVKKPLDVEQAREAVKRLKKKGAESVAVVLLFSFLNPEHERALGEMIKEEFPDGSVSLSSEILPQIREFPRLSTTVANARLAPAMIDYLGKLAEGLRGLGITTEQLYIMQSNGGVAKITSVIPITTLLSGPCAGSEAGMQIADSAGFSNMVSFDMGGTSSDIALGENGSVLEQTSVLVGDWEIAAPMLMINTIGAGGGTIAWIDGGGALQVGPHSAGADPGPVAYDKGGTQPTVTDANLLLGFLHPEYLLGGKVKTNRQKAYEAVVDMGKQLGIEPMATAEGIIRIINAKMEEGIREVSTERGYDLRNFVLVAFGGAGPVHAGRLAADLGMSKVVVPPMPGVSSALGLIMADPRRDFVRSRLTDLEQLGAGELGSIFEALRDHAVSEFKADGFDEDSIGCSLPGPGLRAERSRRRRREPERTGHLGDTRAVRPGARAAVRPQRQDGAGGGGELPRPRDGARAEVLHEAPPAGHGVSGQREDRRARGVLRPRVRHDADAGVRAHPARARPRGRRPRHRRTAGQHDGGLPRPAGAGGRLREPHHLDRVGHDHPGN